MTKVTSNTRIRLMVLLYVAIFSVGIYTANVTGNLAGADDMFVNWFLGVTLAVQAFNSVVLGKRELFVSNNGIILKKPFSKEHIEWCQIVSIFSNGKRAIVIKYSDEANIQEAKATLHAIESLPNKTVSDERNNDVESQSRSHLLKRYDDLTKTLAISRMDMESQILVDYLRTEFDKYNQG